MRGAQIAITHGELKKCQRENVPASMVRQRLIQAGAPEGFKMADVTRHDRDGVIHFVWMEPPGVSNEVQNCNDCQVPGCQNSDESCCTGFVGA